MIRKILAILMLSVLVSCGAGKESAAVRHAEQQQAHAEKKAEREHKKMVKQHFKKQKKETKKALRDYKKRARKLNRPKRFHPYIWYLY